MKTKRFAAIAAAMLGSAIGLAGASLPALAQQAPIERVRLTDNELSCAQLHAEVGEMDRLAAEARAAENEGNTTALAGTAGNVATEVAARTGLFGSLGGLTGHILGQVAGKTAAGAAQQSGQTAAQQAVERGRQAAARKENVSALFLNKGCKTSDLSYNPPTPAPANTPTPMPIAAASPAAGQATGAPTAITLPELNPAEWFDGKMGGTFGEKSVAAFTRSKRVALAGFRVVFVTHDEASAITRGSYLPGRDTGTAKAKIEVDLQGVDDATLQAITDAAYQRFVGQLKAAGREVITADQMQPSYAEFQSASAVPQEVSRGVMRGRAFTPTGVPLWWQAGDAWGDAGLSQTNMRAFNELSKSVGAIAIAPGIVIDFARMQSSGNRSSLTSSGAEVGATLSMSVSTFTTRVVRAEETRYGGIVFKGDDGALNLTRRLDTDAEFADMQKVDENNKGTVMSLFGALGARSSQSVNVARTTNLAYANAANAVLAQATGTFARLFVTNEVAKQ